MSQKRFNGGRVEIGGDPPVKDLKAMNWAESIKQTIYTQP